VMRKTYLTLLGVAALAFIAAVVSAQGEQTGTTSEPKPDNNRGLIAIGAGIAVGLAGLGAGIGEKAIGAAAVGAMAEDPKFFGKGLLMTVIPETIVIFGLVVSILLLFVF
jgi:V/A-type H+/Na+-transporting ATPase subunit K